MSPVSFMLNVLWVVLGGFWMALGWAVAAVIMAINPSSAFHGRAAPGISPIYTLFPFGQKAVSREIYIGERDFGTGIFGFIGNLIWLILAGWWLALGHLFTALLLAITIIGIPFAWAHLKLGAIALWPIGKTIVPA